jgi:hypothetical protein
MPASLQRPLGFDHAAFIAGSGTLTAQDFPPDRATT